MAFMLVYLCRNEGVHTRMLGAGLLGEKGYSYDDPYMAAAGKRYTAVDVVVVVVVKDGQARNERRERERCYRSFLVDRVDLRNVRPLGGIQPRSCATTV